MNVEENFMGVLADLDAVLHSVHKIKHDDAFKIFTEIAQKSRRVNTLVTKLEKVNIDDL